MSDFTPDVHDCLLVIDVQNDFCTDGALAVPDGDAVVPLVNHLAHRFRCVVFTQDWHPAGHSSFASVHPGKSAFDTIMADYGEQTLWPDHCIQGSAGAAFHPQLDQLPAQLVVRKGFRPAIDSYSAFQENDRATVTGLAGWLQARKIKRVVCVGLAYDFCVRFSAEDAVAAGFEAIVLESACRAIDMPGPAGGSRQVAAGAMTAAGVQLVP